MKKLVRTNLTNSPTRRGTENLNIQFYSHDRNNAGFEFVVSNESDLTQYTAKVLFNFTDSASTWEANGIVEGNVVKVSFNTDLIARCEEVLGYLFLDSDSDSLDVFKFKFNVVLSEIDKGEVANRQIKHVNNIGDLELVTRSQLTEELSKLQINSVDLTNYLTTTVADERYALKNEIPSINGFVTTGDLTEAKKNVIEEIKKLGYAKTTEVPAAYNDSELAGRVTALESKAIEGGAYDDSDLRNRVTTLENKPPLDTSEFVTNQTLESKGYIKDVSNLVTKEELESKNYLITPYNDTPLKERVEVLENKVDKDTIYNDTELRNRVEVLENKPNVDLSNYVTSEQLENKHYLTQHQELSHLATTSDLEALRNIAVSKAELSKKLDTTEYNSFKDSVVTKTELAEKGYLTTHQDISNLATKQEVENTYAKKSELPTPYNDSALVQKIGQLEARVDNDTVYDDEPIKQRLTALESRPTSQSEMRGTGMPNGVVEAPIGTTYIDTAKTNGALKWIKTTDGGNTGWKVAEGDTGWVLGWQEDKGNNTNRMYFRRKNDVVHVKFEPKIHDYTITPEVNLILDMGGNDITYNLSIQGFQPIDDILQTFFKKTIDVYSELYNSENSKASQGTGVVVLRYLYNDNSKTGLELLIATSELGVEQNHVNPFSYLTEDEWPVQLP